MNIYIKGWLVVLLACVLLSFLFAKPIEYAIEQVAGMISTWLPEDSFLNILINKIDTTFGYKELIIKWILILGIPLIIIVVYAGCYMVMSEITSRHKRRIKHGCCCENGLVWDISGEGVLTVSGKEIGPFKRKKDIPWLVHSDVINKIIINEGVVSIYGSAGFGAFSGFNNLVDIELPSSIEVIGSYSFAENGKLTKVVIPCSVTYIGKEAFAMCNIGKLVLNKGLQKIEEGAFYYCPLTEIDFYGNENDWQLMEKEDAFECYDELQINCMKSSTD